MEISERIKLIMKHYQLNATQLATQLDVQRSGISHLISGRNKPGLDFIQKLLLLFPDVDALWLINGQGEMIKHKVKKNKTSLPPSPKPQEVFESHPDIEQIVIFYKDKTFSTYKKKPDD